MAAKSPSPEAGHRLEVLWWDQAQGAVQILQVALRPGNTCGQIIDGLPAFLRQACASGQLRPSSHGRSLHSEDMLGVQDRLELLGAIQLDVRAERAARVKAVRARSRNPYNRSYPGGSEASG